MNAALTGLGYPPHGREDYRYFVGNGMELLTRRSLPPDADPDAIARCLTLFTREYETRWHNRTMPYQGISELLAALQRRKIPLAVLSNKSDRFTKLVVDRFFGAEFFCCVMGAREGVPKKPDPSATLQISRLIGIAPSRFLFVGDSGVDMKTAVGAGMTPIGVAWGFRTREELLTEGAVRVLEKPCELLSYFDP